MSVAGNQQDTFFVVIGGRLNVLVSVTAVLLLRFMERSSCKVRASFVGEQPWNLPYFAAVLMLCFCGYPLCCVCVGRGGLILWCPRR